MGLDALLAKLEMRGADTPDTPCNRDGVSAKPAPLLACTLDTPDTPQNEKAANDAQEVVDVQAVRAWLALIEETDPAIIDDVLSRCREDADALAYFVGRAAEVLGATS